MTFPPPPTFSCQRSFWMTPSAQGKIQVMIPQPAKLDLNKKSFPKQKTIQNFTIDAQGFRKIKNENPITWEKEVTS